MIIDKLGNWRRYPFGPAWAEVMGHLERHADDIDANITVHGCEIRHERGQTRPERLCFYESHRKMADIQMLRSGCEWIRVTDGIYLPFTAPFDVTRDCGRHLPPVGDPIRITLVPGMFAVFFPREAHMALIAPDGLPAPVDKLIVKMPAALMTSG